MSKRTHFTLDWGEFRLELGRRMVLMGIVNITPDSFSDGGEYFETNAAIAYGRRLVEQGVDILDIGGESTRPGAEPVDADEEMDRILPVIEALSEEVEVPICVDTSKPEVAEAALEAGAAMINDIYGLRRHPEMAELAGRFHVPVIAMHMRGTPATMQDAPQYEDLLGEIMDSWRESIAIAVANRLPREFVILDPGLGFGKTREHNRVLLNAAQTFLGIGQPLLYGPSRKSFLRAIVGEDRERLDWATAATVHHLQNQGVHICRVHHLERCRQGAEAAAKAPEVLDWLEQSSAT